MIPEAIAGLGAVKTAFDLAKGLKAINDASIRNSAIIELQEQILTAQAAQASLLERIGQLEKQVVGFEKWETEKEKYELKEIYPHNFAHAIKADARGTDPFHLLCTNCYEAGKKSTLQKSSAVHLKCPICKTEIQFKGSDPLPSRANRTWSP